MHAMTAPKTEIGELQDQVASLSQAVNHMMVEMRRMSDELRELRVAKIDPTVTKDHTDSAPTTRSLSAHPTGARSKLSRDPQKKPDQETESSSDPPSPVSVSAKKVKTGKIRSLRIPDSEEDLTDEEMGRVARLVQRTKEAPKPESYSIESGRSLRAFLRSFESYCRSRYGLATKEDWTPELGRLLTGS